jgi:hypothetical protein
MKKEKVNNSRRNFLKMAAFGGAAIGIFNKKPSCFSKQPN